MADTPLSLRMSDAERAALDACRAELAKSTGLQVTRSGFVRYALASAADQFGHPWPTMLTFNDAGREALADLDAKEPR